MQQFETDKTIAKVMPGHKLGGKGTRPSIAVPAGATATSLNAMVPNEMVLKFDHIEKQVRTISDKVLLQDTQI